MPPVYFQENIADNNSTAYTINYNTGFINVIVNWLYISNKNKQKPTCYAENKIAWKAKLLNL